MAMKVRLTIVAEFEPVPGHYLGEDFTPGAILAVEKENLEDMGPSEYLNVFDEEDIEVTLQIVEL